MFLPVPFLSCIHVKLISDYLYMIYMILCFCTVVATTSTSIYFVFVCSYYDSGNTITKQFLLFFFVLLLRLRLTINETWIFILFETNFEQC